MLLNASRNISHAFHFFFSARANSQPVSLYFGISDLEFRRNGRILTQNHIFLSVNAISFAILKQNVLKIIAICMNMFCI